MKRQIRLVLASSALAAFFASTGAAQEAPEAPAPETPAPAAAAPEAAPAGTAGYDPKLGTMEEQVNGLKEQVFRSKATLQLLKELVIQGSNDGAQSTILHYNDLSNSYRLESVAYYLDGQSVYARFDPSGALHEAEELRVFEGALPPGQHQLSVNMVLRGHGFGIFNYVEGYTFTVQSNYTFAAAEGESARLAVTVNEKKRGSFTEKPQVAYKLETTRLVDDQAGQ